MKVLIVSPFENAATGRGDRNIRLERELIKRGHDVTFVTGNFDHAKKVSIPKNDLSQNTGHLVIHLPRYRSNVSLARMWCHLVFGFKLWFRCILTRWDVVVVSSVPPDALLAARFLRKNALVVDVRDIWPDAIKTYGQTSLSIRLFTLFCDLIYRLTLKHADRIMLVAPGFRHWLSHYGKFRHGQVKFVPLGFRREDFRPLSDGGGDAEFCYAGGATPQFDIREFADEFANRHGFIVGSGPLIADWQKSFPESSFFGPVPRAEAIRLMSKSKTLLFPSNPFAQLPNKAFDYFALGYPVVFGENCARATKSLFALRLRHREHVSDDWTRYQIIEKEAIAKRAASIVEEVCS